MNKQNRETGMLSSSLRTFWSQMLHRQKIFFFDYEQRMKELAISRILYLEPWIL